MKKVILNTVLLATTLALSAQNKVTVQKFDLETVKKEKWRIFGGYKDTNGELVIKLGSPQCDMSKNKWTGTYTFSGVAWDFEEVRFDNSFNFIRSESKHFNTSIEALAYEPVWGKRFSVAAEGWSGGGGIHFDTRYIGQKTVVSSATLFGQPTIVNGYIYSQVNSPSNNQKIVFACSETPTMKVISSVAAKTAKGEKWMFVKGYHEPGGGVLFYQRAGTGMDDSKLNYILNKYDENANEKVSKLFTFDYNNACQLVELKKSEGTSDYAIISQAVKKAAPKGAAIKEADFAEVIIVDGQSLEIKLKEPLKLKYAKWFIRYGGYSPDGSVILMGPAADNNTEYLPMPGSACMAPVEDKAFKGYGVCNMASESPNFQTLVIKNNKVVAVNGVSKQEAQSLVTVLDGTPFKAKAEPVFTATTDNLQRLAMTGLVEQQNHFVHYINNKIIVSFESFLDKKGSEFTRNGWVTMMLDNAGKLEKYWIMPTNGFATSDQLFSSNGESMYWACYEPNGFNEKILDSGLYSPKAAKNIIGAQVLLTKINLSNNSASPVQVIGGKEYLINASSPLIAHTDSELLFQGRTTDKKAKDSELVLIRVEK